MPDQDFLFESPQPPESESEPTPNEKPTRKKRKAAPKNEPEAAKLSFEEALAKLEQIVAEMESGKLGLEDVMKRFEEGSVLAAQCTQSLQAVEKRVEVLLKNSEGEGKWEAFNE